MEEFNAGQRTTTSVSISLEDARWLKQNDIKVRSAIVAGIKYLKGTPDAMTMQNTIFTLQSELRRLQKYRDITLYIFKHHAAVYDEARRFIYSDKDEV